MIKHIIRWLVIVIGFLLLSTIGLLTPRGLKITAFVISKTIIPGHIHYEKIEGTILGPITISELEYTNNDYRVSINHLKWHWRWLGQLRIKNLIAENIQITSLKAKDSYIQKVMAILKDPNLNTQIFDFSKKLHRKLESFRWKIPLIIENASLEDIQFNEFSKPATLQLQNINFDGFIKNNQFHGYIVSQITKPSSIEIEASLIGTVNQYHIKFMAGNPQFHWRFTGEGDTDKIFLQTKESEALGGKLSGHLLLNWSEKPQWQLSLNAKHFKPVLIDPQWPKQMDFNLETQGQVLKNKSLLHLNSFFHIDKAIIKLNADHDSQWNINWNINIPELAKLMHKNHGLLISSGIIRGDLLKPSIEGQIDAKSLGFKNFSLGQLSSHWNLDFTSHQSSQFHLNVSDIIAQNITSKQWQLDSKGYLDDQQIKMNQLQIKSDILGAWQLSKPQSIQLTPRSAQLKSMCLNATAGGNACVDVDWKHDKWQTKVFGQQIKNAFISSYFSPNLTVSGPLSFSAIASGKRNKIHTAQLQIKLGPGYIIYTADKIKNRQYYTGHFNAQLDHHGNGLHGILHFDLPDHDYLTLKWQLPNYKDINTSFLTEAFNSEIHGQTKNLSLLTAFLPNVSVPKGKLITKLNLGGTLKNPIINGNISLENGSLQIPELNLALSNINVRLSSQQKILNYLLEAYSNDQPLHIQGNTNLGLANFPTELNLTGNNILIANTKEYQLYASPNLKVKTYGKNVNISGSIAVPKGFIKPNDFRNQVTMSNSDIVIIRKKSSQDTYPWNVSSRISIIFGNDVKIDTFGIQGKITGQLELLNQSLQNTLATGRIFIHDGSYNLFGTPLTIDPSSNIQYTNSPITNPNFNLRASTMVSSYASDSKQDFVEKNMTVGFDLRGTFKSPKIAPFSIPATLSQADILSYLVLGNVDSPQSNGNYSLIMGAFNAMTHHGKNPKDEKGLIDRLRRSLGFSELGIQSATTLDAIGNPIDKKTSFVLGKHLTDRLYVRYSQGIPGPGLTNMNEFTARYKVKKHISIQTNKNTNGSGGDLLFTWDK